MKEFQPIPEELHKYFEAYSGTTLRNYLTSAYIDDRGVVMYDKSKNPLHRFPETYFAQSMHQTFCYAATVAYETNDIPVIMSGKIHSTHKNKGFFPSGIAFPVTSLWVPREHTNRNDLIRNMFIYGDTIAAMDSFVEVDPSALLLSGDEES